MRRSHAAIALLVTAATVGLLAQEATAPPIVFEVAAIKRSANLDPGGSLGLLPGGRFRAVNFDARTFVAIAYRTNPPRMLAPSQIIGAPEWMSIKRYDINAKISPELAATMDRNPLLMPALLRSLLEDRFKLKTHMEVREIPVFALVLARKDSTFGPLGTGRFAGPSVTLDTLATMLTKPVGRLVFDRTGLTGLFDVDLEWAEEAGSDKPSIFAAVQEQLGLKLESVREPVAVVVIDHVERPVED